jgi:hypothetical protein
VLGLESHLLDLRAAPVQRSIIPSISPDLRAACDMGTHTAERQWLAPRRRRH